MVQRCLCSWCLQEQESSATGVRALHLATMLSYLGNHDRACSVLFDALRPEPSLAEKQSQLGWLLLQRYQHDELARSENLLDQALASFQAALMRDAGDLQARGSALDAAPLAVHMGA